MELNFIPNQTFFKVQIKQSGNLVGEFVIKYNRSKIIVVIGKNTKEDEVKIEQKFFGTHDLPRLAKLPTSYSLNHFIVKIYKYGQRYKLFILERNGGYKGRILIYQNAIIHLDIDKNFEIKGIEEIFQESVQSLKQYLEGRVRRRIPKPVKDKGLPRKAPKDYKLDKLRKDKEKWIKWFLSMIKDEHPRYSYTDIVTHILRNDGKIKSRTICHDKLQHAPDFDNKKAWSLCQKVWLLLFTNKATALKIAKKLDETGEE